MAEFAWEARGRTGEVRKGVMEAENEAVVQNRLRAQQLSPTRVKKKGLEGSLTTCTTTDTFEDPEVGTVTVDLTVTGFFTPRRG